MLGKAGGEDLDALSSKELDFRETILKNEKKKKRKEKRLLERQQRKIRTNNTDDALAGATTTGEGGSTKSEDDEDEEEESQTKSNAPSEDSDSVDPANLSGGSKSGDRSKNPKQETDGISSVTTKQTRVERNLYILRLAIDEKFIPQSIKNLRYAANVIFVILLLLASKFFHNLKILQSFITQYKFHFSI